MKEYQKKKEDSLVIDIQHIGRTLLHRAWIILLAALLMGVAAFSISTFLIRPTYSASVMLYVNNFGNTDNSGSIVSSSQIAAAQDMAKTYSVILESNTTMQMVIDSAELSYSVSQLKNMVTSAAVNDSEVLRVTVTSADPEEAANIANVIAEVLPLRAKSLNGADVRPMESAEPSDKPVTPSIPKNTVLGVIIGAVIAAAILVVIAVADDRIHDETYVLETYDYPILAKVPNLMERFSKHRYGYYSKPKEK